MEETDELEDIDYKDERAKEVMRDIISGLLYFGSRAGICYLIYNAILACCIAIKPILEYSQPLHDNLGFLAIGIFLFLAINGKYLNSVK